MAVKAKPVVVEGVISDDRQSRINSIIDKRNRKAVKDGITTADRPILGTIETMAGLRGERLPTGNVILDYYLGPGYGKFKKRGLTRGTSSLWWGPPGTGKSMHCMLTAAITIRNGGYVLWIQAEEGDTLAMAKVFGINPEDGHFIHQDVRGSGEMAFEVIQDFLMANGVATDLIDLVVVDSIAALAPKEELAAIEKDGLGNSSQGMALPQRMMSRLFRIIHAYKMHDRCHIIFVSQSRVDLGAYMSPDKAQGGRGTSHGVRLNLRFNPIGGKAGLIMSGEKVVGHKYRIKFIKEGIRHKYQNLEFENTALYGHGLDDIAATYHLVAVELGGVTTGSWFSATDELRGFLPPGDWKYNGKEKFMAALEEDKILYQGCQDFIAAKSAENRVITVEPDDAEMTNSDEDDGVSLEGAEDHDDRGDA